MEPTTTGRIEQSDFRPAWWLKSAHLQTIWPSLFRPRHPVDVTWERMELADGDFIDLAWRRRQGPLVLMIHGLEGSLDSHYAGPMLTHLGQAGFSTVFMHLRGCGREPNRLDRSYHSGASDDLAEVLSQLAARGEEPDALIGVSLGGNLLLKYLGEKAREARTRCAVAISVPFRLKRAATRLQQGFAKLYGQYLLNRLKRSYRQKFSRRSCPLDVSMTGISSLYQFDQLVTAPLNGFAGADDYYHRCSCIGFLKQIETPTLILHAIDDPLMYQDVIPGTEELGPGVCLELSRYGGHVGFIQGREPGRPSYWLEQRVARFLTRQLLE